jgi:uncharacterized membrane protein
MAVNSVGLSVKLLLAFASTVVPGISLLEIHGQGFCSLLDTYVFRNGRGRSYYVDVFVASMSLWILCILCHCSIQRFPVNAGLCIRLCLHLCNYFEVFLILLYSLYTDRIKRRGPHRRHCLIVVVYRRCVATGLCLMMSSLDYFAVA